MNKIKKIAENIYYSIFNIVDYASYTFFHFFFGADIVTKVVVVAIALVGLVFLALHVFQLFLQALLLLEDTPLLMLDLFAPVCQLLF